QGIKKGVLELADIVAINKADGKHVHEAKLAARELADALHLLQPANADWSPPVLTCSGLDDTGLDDVWAQITSHRETFERTGALASKRTAQQVRWMWAAVEDQLLGRLKADAQVRAVADELVDALGQGSTTPTRAAAQILATFQRVQDRRTGLTS
ncbi:MAG: rane ATPase/protein kinase, partial [Acidimicrobiales bacterium]|nr:rane ATPase/protein kinase [Acidimicrobiales bacterium]